jgi:hypothetical protein
LGSADFAAFARISKILFGGKAHIPTSGRLQGRGGLGYSDWVSVGRGYCLSWTAFFMGRTRTVR